jgi:hypothetical protein
MCAIRLNWMADLPFDQAGAGRTKGTPVFRRWVPSDMRFSPLGDWVFRNLNIHEIELCTGSFRYRYSIPYPNTHSMG